MVARAVAVQNSYAWPDGTVPYQQWGNASPTGDRPDCSGYVGNCCWGIGPEVNTVSLVTDGWMYEIDPKDLLPGDALGKCGPGTAGNDGHIQLFLGFTNSGLFIAEQSGGLGPQHHTVKRITPGYKAYRFKAIEQGEGEVGMSKQDAVSAAAYAANGSDADGYPPGDPANVNVISKYNVRIVEERLNKRIDDWGAKLLAAIKAIPAGGGGGGGGPVNLTQAAIDAVADATADEIAKDPERDGSGT